MRILLTSEYDREVLLEDDITPETIHQELSDRILEIEVSLQDISDWLDTDQSSLKVSESFGETISIIKADTDTFPTMFVDCEGIYDTDDLYNQVVDYSPHTPEIDMDIGEYPYDEFNTASDYDNDYEKLRRWVESHPIQWHKLTFKAIASKTKVSSNFVYRHLCKCAISAKYVATKAEYKRKRKQSRGYKKEKKVRERRNPTVTKIHAWLRQNYNRWQSMTFDEISQETETSRSAVYTNLPKLLLAEGFISNLSEYDRTRKLNRGYKGKENQEANYIIDII